MADTNALILLEEVVTRFLLKYKKTTEDYTIYLEHAANVVRDFQVHDSTHYKTVKIAVDALGIIEMPDDLIKLNGVMVAKNGEWWTFTERPEKVNTTTSPLGVEGHDTDFGEGIDVLDSITSTYGAVGGVNQYYYMVDMDARRIFCDGIISDTVVIKYVSSGISTTASTYIPEMLTPMVDSYLLWKETYWIPELLRERDMRKRDFTDERLRIRNVLNGLTASQWRDLFWGNITMTPKR